MPPTPNHYQPLRNCVAQASEPKIVLDLCCGRGGWAKGFTKLGWRAIGVDVDERFAIQYVGEFYHADVREIAEEISHERSVWKNRLRHVSVVVASPPCPEFTRHGLPWTKRKDPPAPDTSIWRACEKIAHVLEKPYILENVRFAQPFMGKAVRHFGPFYLWGSGVPHRIGVRTKPLRPKENRGSQDREKRAEIPIDLAIGVAKSFMGLTAQLRMR